MIVTFVNTASTANLDVVVVIVPGHQMGSGAARLACADHAALQHRHGLACDASQNCYKHMLHKCMCTRVPCQRVWRSSPCGVWNLGNDVQKAYGGGA